MYKHSKILFHAALASGDEFVRCGPGHCRGIGFRRQRKRIEPKHGLWRPASSVEYFTKWGIRFKISCSP